MIKKNITLCVFIIISILLIFNVNGFAQEENEGTDTSPASFLDLPIGTRNISMGGAFIAIADCAETIFLNPAGLLRLNYPYISMSGDLGSVLYDGMFTGYLAFALPPSENGRLGFGLGVMGTMSYENVPSYDPSGNSSGDNVRNYNIAPYISLALRQSIVDSGGGIGISIKGIYSEIDSVSGYGAGIDLGVLANLAAFSFGLTIKDLFTFVKYKNRDYIEIKSPVAILAAAYRNVSLEDDQTTMVISIEIKKPLLNNEFDFSIGGYYRLWNYVGVTDDNINIDNIINDIDDEEKNGEFGTALYLLGGYNFKTLSLGLSFTWALLNMKLDVATKFPTTPEEYFSLYSTLEFHF
jgi:hypothetical protein